MKKIIAGIVASAFLAATANAATTLTDTYSVSFGTHTTEFDPTQPSQAYAINNFTLFDSTKGTLTGISVQETYQENSNITLTNTGSSAASGTVNSRSVLTINASDGNIDAVLTNLISAVVASGTSTCFGNVPGTCNTAKLGFAPGSNTMSFTSNSPTVDVTSDVYSTASDLQFFQAVGGGLAELLASTYTTTNQSFNGGNVSTSQTTTASPTFSITYYYTAATGAVPEPATWAMMIGGFGLVGFGMRRRGVSVVFS